MMRGTYTTQRRAAKWWMPLFTWTLDVAAVNSYAVWLAEVPEAMRPGRLGDRDSFQKGIIRGLLGLGPGGRNESKLNGVRTKAEGKRTASAAGIGSDDAIKTKVPKEFFKHLDIVNIAKRDCAWCFKCLGERKPTVTRCAHPSCNASLHTWCWYSYAWHADRFKWVSL